MGFVYFPFQVYSQFANLQVELMVKCQTFTESKSEKIISEPNTLEIIPHLFSVGLQKPGCLTGSVTKACNP